MIGILILGQKEIAEGLIHAVEHTLGRRPPAIEAVAIDYQQPPERLAEQLRASLARVDQGDGVLILADIFGTTHTNVACRFVRRGRIELISGASLPMLLRALTYRHLDLPELVDRALMGGFNGIICAGNQGTGTAPEGKDRP